MMLSVISGAMNVIVIPLCVVIFIIQRTHRGTEFILYNTRQYNTNIMYEKLIMCKWYIFIIIIVILGAEAQDKEVNLRLIILM